MSFFQDFLVIVACWYIVISVVTFATYGLDKRKAQRAEWRIKEQTLHMMELLGGWPGALIAQRYFHHKWSKTKFMLVFWAIVVSHLLLWITAIFLRFQRRT